MTPSPAAPETPTPPTPSLAETMRAALDDMGAMYGADEEDCECGTFADTGTCWHVRGHRALAAEEARDRRQREAARLFQRDDVPDNRLTYSPDDAAPSTHLELGEDTAEALRRLFDLETSR